MIGSCDECFIVAYIFPKGHMFHVRTDSKLRGNIARIATYVAVAIGGKD